MSMCFYCDACSVVYILFSLYQLALIGYPHCMFFMLIPQLQYECQDITCKDGTRQALLPIRQKFLCCLFIVSFSLISLRSNPRKPINQSY